MSPAPLVLSSTRPAAASSDTGPHAPRVDFIELARMLGAQLSYPRSSPAPLRNLERRLGLAFGQARRARGEGATAWLSLSEAVGLPLAMLDRGTTPHVMIAHNLMRPRMRAFTAGTGSLHAVSRIIVFSRSHATFIEEDLGVGAERVRFVHDKVDERFWRATGKEEEDGSVLSVGRERRDYRTLVEATRALRAQTVIVASSLWATGNQPALVRGHPRVTVAGGISFRELRRRYERAAVVVVPLQGGERYAAGVNAVQEAMAMGKAVVVTATPGIADYVQDGETARLVAPGDPEALRQVLAELLADQGQRSRLGSRARTAIEDGHGFDDFLRGCAGVVEEAQAIPVDAGGMAVA
jgi:glycosyltransferase involved in cell wall biosynthesis